MNHNAYNAGYNSVIKTAGLEKTALNKVTRVALRKLEEKLPGLTKAWNDTGRRKSLRSIWTEMTGDYGRGPDTYKILGDKLHDSVPQLAGSNVRGARLGRIRKSNDALNTNLDVADFEAAGRNQFSGAHKVRKGERFIPAAHDAEIIHDAARPDDGMWYRGNPISSDHDAVLMSRYPDVAAGYASGNAGYGGMTAPSNRLFAYKKDAIGRRALPETAADWQRGDPTAQILDESFRAKRQEHPYQDTISQSRKLEKGLEELKPAMRQDFIRRRSRYNPNYETVVDVRGGLPAPAQEYSVRRSQQGDQIGYALKEILDK